VNWKALLAALAIVTAVAAFFLVATPPRGEAQPPADVDWDAVVDDESETLEISILVSSVGSEGSWVETMMEERFNVRFKPVFLGPEAHKYRKPLMLAGGDVPDVFVEPDPIEVQRDAHHGFLLDIPHAVILKHAPNYVRALNAVEPVGWLYADWNGRNYGVPTMYVSLLLSVPGVWRADWLRNVGLVDAQGAAKVPGTLDEMHEALRRFTFDDPDGNGEDDTYGMSGDVTNWWWASFADVFCAHGVTPFDWMERDGEALWGGVLPGTRQALELLHAWYAEGIIHPDFVTDKSNESLHRKFQNGRTGYLYYAGKYDQLDLADPRSLADKVRKLNAEAEVVCGRFPVGPEGHRGGRVWSGGHVIVFGRHLAEEPEKVVRVLKILDAVATDEAFNIVSKFGIRGTHWDYRDPKVGPNSGVKALEPYTDPNMAHRCLLGSLEAGTILSPCGPMDVIERHTPRKELAFNRTYRKPEWAWKDVLGKPDSVPSAGRYLLDLRNYQMTVFAEIIRGDREAAYFDTFVSEWLRRGGEQMTREATALLETKKRVYRSVGASGRADSGKALTGEE